MVADPFLRETYWSRINRTLDYIEKHLDKSLSLREVAEVAHFSPFHFHRIFRALVGEPLNTFIQRVRLEKAASMLCGNPRRSVTDIALSCGFSGSAVFARAFREMFGMSASEFRRCPEEIKRKICQTERKNHQTKRKNGKAISSPGGYFGKASGRDAKDPSPEKRRRPMETHTVPDVRVETLPDIPVAYVRHIGPYKGDAGLFQDLFQRLMRWAGPRGLLDREDARILIVYHDNPDVTDETRLRTSVCLEVPADIRGEGEIGVMTVPGGRYAMGRFELSADEFQDAWDALCGRWLPESGYQPDNRPCFELCLNDPETHPDHKHLVDICIPVLPMTG